MPGIMGLRSELSAPWNRQQADSLAQVFIEAGPRYQLKGYLYAARQEASLR